jgi:hypothetical protein
MLKPLLAAMFLILAQKEEARPATGIISGIVVAPAQTSLPQPLLIVLLPPKYADLWNSDVQRRLDGYWERFKPAFAQQKDIFVEATRIAYLESTQSVVARMRRDIPDRISDFIQQSSPEGRFEFKNVPMDEYYVLAVGQTDGRDLIWQELIDVRSAIPQFLQLKKMVP